MYLLRLIREISKGPQAGRGPASSRVLLRYMAHEPRPLIYPPGGIGLIWSAKSACTTAVLWYLGRAGLLEEALRYHSWPHRYRMDILPNLEAYRHWLQTADLTALRWVRVIRDPQARAVSSYRHALRFGYENEKIERRTGLAVAERGFSFDEFLDYLLKIDVRKCNLHHRQQWYPLEKRLKRVQVVNVDKEPLLDTLYAFADPGPEARALLASEMARIAKVHHASRTLVEADCSSVVFQQPATNGQWPDNEAFLNAGTRAKIARIYAKDFSAYAPYL
ncbi:MAG: sulfotransferase family 2 domain-containing protein [Bauldia sp.]|nr:sulfotransferase family 2 domain-containing protein [Bauldia sp.]